MGAEYINANYIRHLIEYNELADETCANGSELSNQVVCSRIIFTFLIKYHFM